MGRHVLYGGGQLVQIRIFPIALRLAFWQLEACRASLGCLKGLVLGLTCPCVDSIAPNVAYRTKCVSTLGASAQVDAPFSAV